MLAKEQQEPQQQERIFYFDIDNCLYSPNLGIDKMMKERIYAYSKESGLDPDSVDATCSTYYRDYGLSIRGLIKHHGVDPADYNNRVDGSLPLEDLIKPDPELRKMIESIKTRRWAFTNAGIDHAKRVLKCLQIEDLFEGITYCDYTDPNFPCKPEAPAFEKAMKESGCKDPNLCFFADDNVRNIEMARKLGWTAVHVSNQPEISNKHGGHCVMAIHQLPLVLPYLFE